MSYDLCLSQQANQPYYIENIRTGIYSLEELCFYLYNNICLIDESIINEKLCDWIRDELHLTRLYRQLYEQLDKIEAARERTVRTVSGSAARPSPTGARPQEGARKSTVPEADVASFVFPIFREAGYLNGQEMRDFQEQMAKLEVQSDEMKQKLRGDYLVKEKMYARAVWVYRQILKNRNPGKLGSQFYAAVWNNLGAAYAGLFRFEEAAECFLEAYNLMKTKEMFRKYVSVLPLFLSEEEYQLRLIEIKADEYLVKTIQEYNAKLCQNPEFLQRKERMTGLTADAVLEELKEQYARSTRT
ncbi:MAG: tetratricopeptide repeat protein [Lachnospiraceae bacterium]|nr:tetratricopeptide repeat protein [Lachnospiraceae bacterium]